MTKRREETFRLPVGTLGELEVYQSAQEAGPNFAVVYVHGFGSSRIGEKPKALAERITGAKTR